MIDVSPYGACAFLNFSVHIYNAVLKKAFCGFGHTGHTGIFSRCDRARGDIFQ